MPVADVRGVQIHYEVIGAAGPWVSLAPGGRRGVDYVRSLAQRIADAGFRVLVHDRRNCGASEAAFDDSASEYEVWADDLADANEARMASLFVDFLRRTTVAP